MSRSRTGSEFSLAAGPPRKENGPRALTSAVLIDAENVRRSRWPNVPATRLVALCRSWAAREGVRAVVVFDGEPPGGEVSEEGFAVRGSGPASADELLALIAADLAREGTPYRLVTSDRRLRAEAGRLAEQTTGGGSFLHQLVG